MQLINDKRTFRSALFALILGALCFAPLFANEDMALKSLDEYSQLVKKNFQTYNLEDKDFRYSFKILSTDLITYEMTLFANVNYLFLAVSDNESDNVEIEGKFGFEYTMDEKTAKTYLFPFNLSFIKRLQYTFSVPVTGNYQFVFRLTNKRYPGSSEPSEASQAFTAFLIGYELTPKK